MTERDVEGCSSSTVTLGREESDLGALALNPLQDCLIRRIAEATINPLFFIHLIAFTKSFGAIVKGVSEGFVNAGKNIRTGHEDL